MPTPLSSLAQARPYVSLVLARHAGKLRKTRAIGLVFDRLEDELALNAGLRRLLKREEPSALGGLDAGFLHYTEEKPPSWVIPETHEDLTDRVNHLVVGCRRQDHFAFYASDPAARALLDRALAHAEEEGFPLALGPLAPKVLTDAFLQGPARTLWLSGVHRQSAIKADSKVLSGSDLQYALNPLDDQSYHFTAARSTARVSGADRPVGVSRRRSAVWIGTSASWDAFRAQVVAILKAVSAAEQAPLPDEPVFPHLARLANSANTGDAFDLSLVPPELLGESTRDPEAIEMAEKWAYRSSFEILDTDGPSLEATAYLDGETLGELRIQVDAGDPARVAVDVEGEPESEETAAELDELISATRRRGWLKVRYEGGSTLSDGALYSMQFRDLEFGDWAFFDLQERGKKPKTDVKKEKPKKAGTSLPVELIGKQDSLFCWVVRHWFGLKGFGSRNGWLACDDGADEIADFIHLDLEPERGARPRVTLIHVKGSKNGEIDRGVSVSDYEVVCGQAVKNLRALDLNVLADALDVSPKKKKVAAATWQDGVLKPDRKGMVRELRRIGADYSRRVVVLQPRVNASGLARASGSGAKRREKLHMQQLNALLIETSSSCRDLNADFYVVSSDT